MAKPASSRCNLKCHYCFYIEKPRQRMMDDITLERFISQYIAAQPGDEVLFAWQGGEPMLCGLDFYRRVVALQQRYGAGKRISNSLQTNGVLLNDEWCKFLKQHDWLVGISLDGPADLHDALRQTRHGKPTHHKVMAAIEKLRAHNVAFNLLVVVHHHNSQQPQRLYRYLRELGTPFIQFIPLLERDEQGRLDPLSVSASAWGHFLCTIFDIWIREDVGRIFIQLFDSTLAVWCGYPSQMCVTSKTCGHAFALEANGDVYQCDHYVYPAWKLGNLQQRSLTDMNGSSEAIDFGRHKQRSLPTACLECPVLQFCNGDCPKHRDESGKSVLCAGYRHFFSQTSNEMKKMRDVIRQRC